MNQQQHLCQDRKIVDAENSKWNQHTELILFYRLSCREWNIFVQFEIALSIAAVTKGVCL